MKQNITEYKMMQGDYNFKPLKEWQQISTGYFIVPNEKLHIVSKRTDENGTVTIARCTCPDCSDSRKADHIDQACVRLDMSTGLGKCYNCGFRFILGSMGTTSFS